jgi:hypothetical protein
MMSKLKNNNPNATAALSQMPSLHQFYSHSFNIKDQKEAEKHIKEHITAKAEQAVGGERNNVKSEIIDLKSRDKEEQKKIDKERKLLNKQDTTTQKPEEASLMPSSLRQWLDYFLAFICFICGGVSITASMMAMYTLVTSAGIMAIIENPDLAWPFCIPLGLGAIALEFFKRTLRTSQGKRLYAKIIYGMCAILMIAWIVLASKVFGSMADQGFDVTALLEGSGSDPLMSLYTTVQLFLEFFIGCALFMTAGDLIAKHTKMHEIEDENVINQKKRLDALVSENHKTKKELREQEARLHEIDSAMKIYINEQIMIYKSYRSAQMGD